MLMVLHLCSGTWSFISMFSSQNILFGSENKWLFVWLNFVLFAGPMSQVWNESLCLKD